MEEVVRAFNFVINQGWVSAFILQKKNNAIN